MTNTFRKSLVIGLAALCAAAVCFAADDPGDPNGGAPKEKSPKQMVSSSVKVSEKAVPRIWIGITGSFTPLKLIKGNTGVFDSSGNAFSATTANGQVGGGAILNARIYRGFGLSLGAIYRYTGYDANAVLNDINGTSNTERARVRLIDFPVMVRYSGRKWNPSKYTFYELGGVLRRGISERITTNSTDLVTGQLGPGPTTGTRYKRDIFGAVAGAGLIGRDDFGIIVSPEVRYTRWMGQTFNSPIIGSQRNQLELTVSFGF